MRAVAGHAVDDDAFGAKLRPSDAAMLADAAAFVVMHHHPRAERRLALGDAGADRDHDAAGLMTGDHRAAHLAEAERLAAALRGAIEFEIAAAHAGRLDLEHDLARTGRRIVES